MHPTLIAWLRPIRRATGLVVRPNFRKRAGAALAGLGTNVLRHTGVSMRLALDANRNQLAEDAGTSVEVIARFYRRPCRRRRRGSSSNCDRILDRLHYYWYFFGPGSTLRGGGNMTNTNAIAEYRGLLIQTEQESQADFDKGVLALSGGALGLSFAFTKDIVGTTHIIHAVYLLTAWIAWAVSSTSVLVSFLTSQLAMRKAIRQLDRGVLGGQHPGGWLDSVTAALNVAGLALFLFGLAMMVVFLKYNIPLK
jgi:hypothetical protein